MKKYERNYILLVLLFLFSFSACDDDSPSTPSDNTGKLYTKILNESGSAYTITSIRLKDMGELPTGPEPAGSFGENILTNGKKLAPGEFAMFFLAIPNRHWALCKIGVEDSSGKEIIISDQIGYDQDIICSITHWGGDDRTVRIYLRKNASNNLIEVGGWSDWIGIEE